ncbi:RNA polymerase sigma factor [Stappia stellulata]|uniref:RNA polymerase sigma factor n=1 Tax=Stappia stellulata TaxID=71235 RepID=UPI00296F753A|nr:sigma factor [Stappia stellulata]
MEIRQCLHPSAPPARQKTAHSCLIKNRSLYVRYLRWRLSRPEDAKDAYQNFCLKVLRQRDAPDDGAQAEAWLQRVLRATLIDHYRRRASRQRGEEAYTREPREDRNGPEADAVPLYRCVCLALQRLKADHTELIRCIDLEEAPRAGLPPSRV